ncbi:MAG: AsmA-like C-terminal region-containing protein [Pseudomonadota bacterium]
MVRQTAKVLFFEFLGGILFLAVLAAAFFAWRLSQGPVQLDAFKDDIEAALTDARGGRGVSLASVALEWSPDDRQVNVTAYGLRFENSAGAPSGDAHRAELVLDASALLLGRTEILSLRLIEGTLGVEQVSENVWEVAGEPLPPIQGGTLPVTAEEWVGAIERALGAVVAGGNQASTNTSLELVTFERFTIDVTLLDGTNLLTVKDAEGALQQADGDFALSLSGRGDGGGLPRGIAMDLRSEGQFDRLVGEVAAASWTGSDLAARVGLRPESARGLPLDLAVAFEFSASSRLAGVSAELEVGAGSVTVADTDYTLDALSGRFEYDPANDTAVLQVDQVVSQLLSGAFRLSLDEAIRPSEATRPLTLFADDIALGLTPMFAAPLRVEAIELEGAVDFSDLALSADDLAVDIGSARLTGRAAIARAADAEDGEIPFRLDADMDIRGPLDVSTVTAFWPVRLGAGARRFAVNRIEAGVLSEGTAKVAIRPDSLAEGHLRDGDLDIRFSARDTRVRYLSDMPPVSDASVIGRLTGNSFSIELASGTLGSWQLTSASLDFPRLNPRGSDMIVAATGEGSAVDMVRYIFESGLQLEERTGFDPDRISGDAKAIFDMRRPALDNVPLEDMDIRVTAEVLDGGLDDLVNGIDLRSARARVDVDTRTVRVTGRGEAGPADVSFAWRDDFDDGDGPSVLSAQATVTPDMLNAFGVLGRPYLSGEIPIDISATLDGNDVRTADLSLDLDGARLDLAEVGWLKPPGEPARAIIKYDFTGETQRASADLQSEAVGLSGDVILGPDGRLRVFTLDRAFFKDRVDVSGQIERRGDDTIAVALTGPFLDASPLFADLGAFMGSGSAAGAGTALSLRADVDRLRFSVDRDLTDATFEAVADATGFERMSASGVTGDGDAMRATYQRNGAGADISLISDDAGFLVNTLFGELGLQGGSISLTGRLEWDGAPSRLLVNLSNARLREAPFLTQLLSIASLRGLVDTLGGEGILFSDIRLPLVIADGRYVVEGGRASGPALGFTLNGWVEPESERLEMTGVLVPSFGVNSALGGVPIIGDLMVGREGEGILSLTYSIRGAFDRAQVAVNPFSAVAPGVLRRIFENPADTELPLPDTVGEADATGVDDGPDRDGVPGTPG